MRRTGAPPEARGALWVAARRLQGGRVAPRGTQRGPAFLRCRKEGARAGGPSGTPEDDCDRGAAARPASRGQAGADRARPPGASWTPWWRRSQGRPGPEATQGPGGWGAAARGVPRVLSGAEWIGVDGQGRLGDTGSEDEALKSGLWGNSAAESCSDLAVRSLRGGCRPLVSTAGRERR